MPDELLAKSASAPNGRLKRRYAEKRTASKGVFAARLLGCVTRLNGAMSICAKDAPPSLDLDGRRVACHLYPEKA